MSRLRFTSLAEATHAVQRLRDVTEIDVGSGTWSAVQALHHCAASIECSVRGFPRSKPWIVRAIARSFVLPKFLRQGFMTHALDVPVPGLDEGAPDRALAPALDRVLAAIAEFEAAPTLAPHVVFGSLPRATYGRYHALHLADHLSAFTTGRRPFTP